MRHTIARLFVLGAALTALGLAGSAAWADEPPPEDFPPPAAPADEEPTPPPSEPRAPEDESLPPEKLPPPTKLPPAEVPKKPAPPVQPKPPVNTATTWSPPAVTPGGTGSALPPPQIIRRRGSGTRPGTPAVRAPVAPRTPIVDVPTTRSTPPSLPTAGPTGLPPRPPPPSFIPDLPTGPAAPATPVTPAAGPSAPRVFPTVTSASRVFGISKTHNVSLPDKDLALQMEVDYEVSGQNGRDVYVGIWFVRTDTGKHIRAALSTYRDPSGFLTLQTRTARVRGNTGRFTATLRIPYRAFPVAQANDSYEVEARVQILRSDGAGRATSLAKGSTTFRVYGFSEDTTPVDSTATP